jgi:hypothetical protein
MSQEPGLKLLLSIEGNTYHIETGTSQVDDALTQAFLSKDLKTNTAVATAGGEILDCTITKLVDLSAVRKSTEETIQRFLAAKSNS